MAPGGRRRDESLRDRVPARERRCRWRRLVEPALVHADRRGPAVRPRHARVGPFALAARPRGRVRTDRVRHAQRAPRSRPGRRSHRVAVPRPAGRAPHRAARRARRRSACATTSWCSPAAIRTVTASSSSTTRRGAVAPTRLRRARPPTRRLPRHRAERRRPLRLRLTILRARAGHRRGPGDRLGTLRARPLLVGAARQSGRHRAAGERAHRRGRVRTARATACLLRGHAVTVVRGELFV